MNYLTPRSWSVNDLNNLNEENFPIIAKPVFRRISSNENLKYITQNMDRLRFNVIKNKEELALFVKKEKVFIDNLSFKNTLMECQIVCILLAFIQIVILKF